MKRVKKRDGCDGKIRHTSRRAGHAHRAALISQGAHGGQLTVYRCQFCRGGWHVGHRRMGGRR